MAVACLHALAPSAASAPLDIWSRLSPGELTMVRRMVDRGFNSPLTSSAGRLFDAVAALLGVRDEITYEGQAAVELEQLARQGNRTRGPAFRLEMQEQDGKIILDPQSLVCGLVEALLDKKDRADLALGFHVALAESLAGACACVRDAGGPEEVVLCGGVFQNRILTDLTRQALIASDLVPVSPGLIPVNDGGIALGQVLAANTNTLEQEE
jgi:hydrogenase maturation protein HypF